MAEKCKKIVLTVTQKRELPETFKKGYRIGIQTVRDKTTKLS
jgi:hypothetical protein